MNYKDFLNYYCGSVAKDGNDYRRAAWRYAHESEALTSSEYVEIFVTNDFEKFTEQKRFTILRELCLINRMEAAYLLDEILGFKQHD